jgi:hypothetical protein
MPAITALLGALAMFTSVVLLVIETRLAVQSTLVEMDYTRQLVDRAANSPDASKAPPPIA